ncbi:hypothetical protein KUM42_13140 [Modestobacter sp. L9-4]|uniref:hypothetical protein n=1 Tax=Modestobacter sp. L9-4 TaxID=2851567 RepID=UPI001C76572A|nr:hypothetical protein [Modestobacter sp. L9-4]QXG74809.1 hypothetical protein KUM42_13140 [Modestobacter sp. L9-4]
MRSMDPQVTATAPAARRRSLNGLALQLSAVALSFILVSLLVVTASHAAFVAQTDNPRNHVGAGAVHLADDDSGYAMFAVDGLTPGNVQERCIKVTYTGTVDAGDVRLYVPSAPTGALAPFLDLTVDIAPDNAAGPGSCTGFGTGQRLFSGTLSSLASTRSDWTTGLSTWQPAGTPETRVFRFRLQVQDTPGAQGLATEFGFTWETRTS